MDTHRPIPSSELLLEHAGWLRRLAEQLLRDPQAADDVVQETWMALLRRGPDSSASLRPWLAQVLRRRVALRMRSRANRAAREQRSARLEALPSAGELVERAEVQRRLVDAVLALDEPYREALLLRYYEGLSAVEIAERRGVPAATVRSQLRRGKEQLRQRLDAQYGGDRARWTMLLIPLTLDGPRRLAGASGTSTPLLAFLGAVLAVVLVVLGLRFFPDRSPRGGVVGRNAPGASALDAPVELAAPEAKDGSRATAIPSTRAWTLVHEAGGAALPEYALRVGGETVVSDAAGRVDLPAAVESVVPVDDARLREEVWPTHYGRVSRAYTRPSLALPDGDELTVPAGPTYRVRLTSDGEIDLESLDARLVGTGLSPYLDDGRPRPLAPLRGTPDAVWVRFGRAPDGADDARAQWTLEVRDRSGHRFGEAIVQDVRVGDPLPVEITLERRAVLSGDVHGDGSVEGAELRLLAAHADAGAGTRMRHALVLDSTGAFHIPWVEAGDYVLDIRSARHLGWKRPLSLAPGEPRTLDVALEALPPGGRLSGVVRSESGGYTKQLLLFLVNGEDEVLGVFPTSWTDEGDARVAPFAFEDLPGVPLRISVVSLGDAVTASVEPAPLEAPCASVDVLLHDAGPVSDVRFDVVDRGTGVPLEAFAVDFVLDGVPRTYRARGAPDERRWTLIAGAMRWNEHDGLAPLRGLPDGTAFSFTVHAEGYGSQHGDESALVRADDGAFDVRVDLARE